MSDERSPEGDIQKTHFADDATLARLAALEDALERIVVAYGRETPLSPAARTRVMQIARAALAGQPLNQVSKEA